MSLHAFSGAPLDPLMAAASVPGQSLSFLQARAAALPSFPDVDRLLHDGWRHGVDAALAVNLPRLSNAGGEVFSGSVAAERLADVRTSAIHALLLWEQRARRIGSCLEAGGVPPLLLLKGGALRYQVYPEPWLRAAADLDLLVPEGQLERAVQALVDNGAEVHLPVVERRWSMRHGHHVTVRQDGFHVELHRSVDQGDRPLLSHVALSDGAVPLSAVHGHLLLPRLSGQALVCAAHALKHGLNIPLKNLVDLHCLAVCGAFSDEDEVVRQARAEKLDGVLGYLLSCAVELLATNVPEGLLLALRPPLPWTLLTRAVLSPWRDGFFPAALGRDTPLRRLAAHLLLVADGRFVAGVGTRFLTRRLHDLTDRG
ncbi:MAG: nucleotidyltransferase family protein [Deltaproteobacteria bacterium]|nr:nucleotidyltransferase family protein [Deltaproteobacteria bacterium]